MKLEEIFEDITQRDLTAVEQFVNRVYRDVGISVEFNPHFLERVNDLRNKPSVTVQDLYDLFLKTYHKWGRKITTFSPKQEGVIKSYLTQLNMPFHTRKTRNGETVFIAKTVQRKQKFTTYPKDVVLTVEHTDNP